MPIEEGKAAPAFSLTDTAGNKVSLKDLKGQNVIVYFYPKDDTPGCTKEACGFRDVWKDMQKHNTTVLGISPDTEASHEKFVNKYKLPFTSEGMGYASVFKDALHIMRQDFLADCPDGALDFLNRKEPLVALPNEPLRVAGFDQLIHATANITA